MQKCSVDFYRDGLTAVPTLEQFQREAVKVLWEVFQDGRLTANSSCDKLLQSDSDAVQAYEFALDAAKSARNRVLRELISG